MGVSRLSAERTMLNPQPPVDITHLKRRPAMVVVLFAVSLGLAALALAAAASPASARCQNQSADPRTVTHKTAAKATICLVNEKRRDHGLRRLTPQRELARAARGHTKAMQSKNCFDHVCPGEPSLNGRLERANYIPCGCSWGTGEAIAWGRGENGDPKSVVKAWMNSDYHRSLILTRSFEHIGVGVSWGSPSKQAARAGTYTLNFGYRD